MKIIFEPEPSERVNIITMTETFINSIVQEFRSMDPEEREIRILSELRCAGNIITAEIDRRCEIRRMR